MMAITCRDFKRTLMKLSYRNKFAEMKGIRTTSFSKRKRVKSEAGIMKVKEREKLGSLYKIVSETMFRKETFAEVIKKYLDEADHKIRK